jgi:hypothetical protein
MLIEGTVDLFFFKKKNSEEPKVGVFCSVLGIDVHSSAAQVTVTLMA